MSEYGLRDTLSATPETRRIKTTSNAAAYADFGDSSWRRLHQTRQALCIYTGTTQRRR